MNGLPDPRLFPNRTVWFGMAGAPIIWSFHLLAIWALTEFGCRLHLETYTILGINAVYAVVLLVTLGAVLLTGYSGYVAYRNWRVLEEAEITNAQEQRTVDRARFMSMAGVSFAVGFLVVILFTSAPVLVLPPCSPY